MGLTLIVLAALNPPAKVWKSAEELTVINAGPWPVSEEAAGGMLRRLPFAAKAVVRPTIYYGSEDTAGLAVRTYVPATETKKKGDDQSGYFGTRELIVFIGSPFKCTFMLTR